MLPQLNADQLTRFWSRVQKTDGCWLWTGTFTRQGYGQMSLDGRQRYAHRIAFELSGGTIPAGCRLKHLCRLRECVNPAHLQPGRGQDCGDGTFTCSVCGQAQPLDHFTRDKHSRHGHMPACKACRLKEHTRWRRENPEKERAMQRRKRKKRIAAGRCGQCGAVNDTPDRHYCSKCRAYANMLRNPHRVAAGPCVVCGFPYADVHHIDGDHDNNDARNLMTLCPNHHRLVHWGRAEYGISQDIIDRLARLSPWARKGERSTGGA